MLEEGHLTHKENLELFYDENFDFIVDYDMPSLEAKESCISKLARMFKKMTEREELEVDSEANVMAADD
jgi:hypothetical protein